MTYKGVFSDTRHRIFRKNLGRLWLAYTELQGDFYMLQLMNDDSAHFTLPELSLWWSDWHEIKSVSKDVGLFWCQQLLKGIMGRRWLKVPNILSPTLDTLLCTPYSDLTLETLIMSFQSRHTTLQKKKKKKKILDTHILKPPPCMGHSTVLDLVMIAPIQLQCIFPILFWPILKWNHMHLILVLERVQHFGLMDSPLLVFRVPVDSRVRWSSLSALK